METLWKHGWKWFLSRKEIIVLAAHWHVEAEAVEIDAILLREASAAWSTVA